jgi:4-hydroxy-tetrahydrodipicolinate synthase
VAGRFSGSIVALVTPMVESGGLDLSAWDRLLDWHLAQGSDGIVVCGTTGESPTVTAAEAAELIARARIRLRGRVPLIAGTGTNSTAGSIERARQAQDSGADALLVVTPYYNKPTQEGLFRHFTAIAESVSIPIILYNVPGRTGVDLVPDTVLRLAAHPRIVAIKEASGTAARARELVTRLDGRMDVLGGEDACACESMLAGASGVISVTANVAPAAMHELTVLARRADVARARELDARLQALHGALFVEANPIPVKWAVEQLGLIGGALRLPLTRLSAAAQPVVREALRALDIPCAA